MKNPFVLGDIKTFKRKVTADDIAKFDSGMVHPVFATFALVRDMEWCGRLFVLEMKDDDEEGVGTFVNVKHVNAALQDEEICFEATLNSVKNNEVVCTIIAKVGQRVIAEGSTGQKIMNKEKLDRLFNNQD